jgi:hypothetical protein
MIANNKHYFASKAVSALGPGLLRCTPVDREGLLGKNGSAEGHKSLRHRLDVAIHGIITTIFSCREYCICICHTAGDRAVCYYCRF